MKAQESSNTGVYAYLSNIGLLDGTAEQIALAKKQYWAGKKREHKRKKRAECKSYTVFLDQKEAKAVAKKAKSLNSSVTNFIKEAALAKEFVPDKRSIGEIRQEITKHYCAIDSLLDEKLLSKETANELLHQVIAIEKKVFALILPNNPLTL